jgi:hypothetical protein
VCQARDALASGPTSECAAVGSSAKSEEVRHTAAKGVEGAVCVCPLIAAFRAVSRRSAPAARCPQRDRSPIRTSQDRFTTNGITVRSVMTKELLDSVAMAT